MSGITEQEARERERKAYVQACMDKAAAWSEHARAQAEAFARAAYPDPVTYGPEVEDVDGILKRRASSGEWEAWDGEGWVASVVTDAKLLAFTSCVPVTDAEVKAASACAVQIPLTEDISEVWRVILTAARAAMRPEGTR